MRAAMHYIMSALAGATLFVGSASVAQSDGSVEEAYAAQCPQHQKTQVCDALRNAMTKSAPAPLPAQSVSTAAASDQGYLGLRTLDLNAAQSQEYGLQSGHGVVVQFVGLGGGAANAGIQQNDILISIDDVPITRDRTPSELLRGDQIGKNKAVAFLRNGQKQIVIVTLATAPTITDYLAGSDGALFEHLSLHAYVWLVEDVAVITTFSWDPAKQLLRYEMGIAGLGLGDPDLHEFTVAPGGTMTGKRKFLGSTSKIKGRKTDASTFTLDPYIARYGGPIRQRYTVLPDGDLSIFTENLEDGRWCCSDNVVVYKSLTGAQFAELRPRYVAAGQAYQRAYNETARLAEAQRKSQSTGLFGALAMGVGAALAGGNAEMITGAAMKGAELTTTDETLRAGLAGQGEAMLGAGLQRRTNEVAQHNARVGAANGGNGLATGSTGSAQSNGQGAAGNRSMSASPTAAGGTRTVRMVLIAGILPTEADFNPPNGLGRNPDCRSNIITATIRKDDRGSNVPVEELFERYRASFVAKCARLGTISTNPTYEIEEPYSIGFGEYGWNDRRVTLP